MWSSGEVADPRLGDKGSGFTKVNPRPTEVSQLGECMQLTERRVLAVQTVITRLAAGSLTHAYPGRDVVPTVPAERKYDEGLLGVVLLSGPHQPRNLKLTTDAAPHTQTHTHTHTRVLCTRYDPRYDPRYEPHPSHPTPHSLRLLAEVVCLAFYIHSRVLGERDEHAGCAAPRGRWTFTMLCPPPHRAPPLAVCCLLFAVC